MEQRFGSANVKWCEERLCSFINEPANAWSNILYLIIGAYLIYQGYKSQKKPSGQFQFFFGCVVYIMGFCSFVYHATNNYLTQILDFIGMFFYIYLLLTLSLYNLKIIKAKTGVMFFLGLVAVSTALIPLAKYVNFPYQVIVAFSSIAIVLLQIMAWNKARTIYPKKDLLWCIFFFVIASIFSFMDVSRMWCNPQNHLIQGHALWHILNAIGVYFSYRMFAKQFEQNYKA
jgi:hypothetical protein